MFNTFREVWYKLRPLDTEHGDLKVSHAVSAPESKGKIYLFKINPKNKLGNFPEVSIFDLREMCPRMDPYWLHLHRLRKDEARKQFRTYLDQYGKNTKYITNNQDVDL